MANYGPSDEGFFEGSVSGSLSSLDSWEGDSLPDLEEDPVEPDEGLGYMLDEWEDAAYAAAEDKWPNAHIRMCSTFIMNFLLDLLR